MPIKNTRALSVHARVRAAIHARASSRITADILKGRQVVGTDDNGPVPGSKLARLIESIAEMEVDDWMARLGNEVDK